MATKARDIYVIYTSWLAKCSPGVGAWKGTCIDYQGISHAEPLCRLHVLVGGIIESKAQLHAL